MNAALIIVKDAGDSLLKPAYHFNRKGLAGDLKGGGVKVMKKSNDIDFVTETDKAVQDFIFARLAQHFPNDRLLGEEGDFKPNNGNAVKKQKQASLACTWVLDPIDGTSNFIHGFPRFCISLAYFDSSSKVTIGIVYNPITEELFSAERGKGAFRNGFPIAVKSYPADSSLKDCFIAFEHGYEAQNYDWLERKMEMMTELFALRPNGIRSLGSCALNLCSIAMGSLDAYYDFGIHIWDFAAGLLIVSEAGGHFTTVFGRDLYVGRKICVAANPAHLKQLKAIVEKYRISNLDNDVLL